MLVTKTPLRISFFGGGSDIPQFYEHNDGMVVSTSINSHIYLAINRCVANHLKVVYSEIEHVFDVNELRHDIVREALKYYGIESNIELCSFSDVTTKGTGLGSSSTFTVGLLNGLHYLKEGKPLDAKILAELAAYIEIVRCQSPIGKQDQYAAACGGLNAIFFSKDTVRVKPIKVDATTKFALENNLLLFNTGLQRSAKDVLSGQVNSIVSGTVAEAIKGGVNLAKHAIKLLQEKKIDDFGNLLDQAWLVKKQFASNITNPLIDEMYETAINAGALGGKLLGAGGGGFLMMYVPYNIRSAVINAMKHHELFEFKFANYGSTIEMHS